MDTDTPDEHHRASAIPASADPGRPAMMIAIAYAAFGLSWVVLPDRLLRSVAPDVATLSAVGQGNGIAFVLASSALLYVVAARRRRAWPAEPLLREAHPHASAWLLGLGADKPVHAETRVATPDGDITERRGLQQRLRQWATVFDQSRDGVVITDARGRIHAVNRAFSTITGYSAQEAIGSGLRLLKSGRPGPEFYRQMWATLDECGHWQGETWNAARAARSTPNG